jgi:hypothetical protein
MAHPMEIASGYQDDGDKELKKITDTMSRYSVQAASE